MNRIQEILVSLARTGVKYPEQIDETWEPIIQAEADIIQLFELVVGKDEQRSDQTMPDDLLKLDWQAKNDLRSKQRQMINETKEADNASN